MPNDCIAVDGVDVRPKSRDWRYRRRRGIATKLGTP